MVKMSRSSKAIVFAILIALLFASFPATSVLAKGDHEKLEAKWSQLVSNYNRQSINHNSAHKWVDHWLKTQKKASVAEKNEVQKHLTICNSAFMAAGAIVSKHDGFDAKGKLVDRAAAQKSIKDLSYYLRQHVGSLHNLNGHIN